MCLAKMLSLGSGILVAILLVSIVKTVLRTAEPSPAQSIGAYYYPWYSLGRWRNDKKVMGRPLLGPYESDDSKVIEQHIDWAKHSGINYFIYSWLGSNKDMHRLEDYYSSRLATIASKNNFLLMPLYETPLALFQSPDLIDFDASYEGMMTAGDRFVEDMLFYARESPARNSTYKKKGCPKIALYLVRNFVNHEKYFDVLSDALSANSLCLEMTADLVFWNSVDRPLQYDGRSYERQWEWISENFSEVFGYNYYTDNRSLYGDEKEFSSQFLSAKQKAQELWAGRASEFNLDYVYSIQPGYDDRPLRGFDRPHVSASSGFYSRDWERIISSKFNGCSVAITSFNEWYEGTAIEPTVGLNSELLDVTRVMIGKFNKHKNCSP